MRTAVSWIVATLTVCALVLLVAGCGDPSRPGLTGAPVGSAPAVTKLLTFSSTGGIAGLARTLTVQSDGSAALIVGARDAKVRYFTVKPARFDELKAALAELNLAADQTYKSPGPVADGFNYTLVYQKHTLRWETEAKPPKEVSDLARVLTRVLDDANE